MITRYTRKAAMAAAAMLCLGLPTAFLAMNTGCSSNSDSYENPAPAISSFLVSKVEAFPSPVSEPNNTGTTISVGSGSTIYFKANFATTGGTGVITPGNIPVTSNAKVTLPTPVTSTTVYTLTVTSANGAKATAQVTVNVVSAPVISAYSDEDATYYAGVQIPDNVPTVTGLSPITYTVAPDLPAGLTLSGSTGIISGTPTVPVARAPYTITARNDIGTTTHVVNIAVLATPITFTASPSSIPLGGGTTLAWDANTVSGLFNAVTLSANPADSSLTGPFALSGTKNVAPVVSTTYTLSATPTAGGAAVTKTVDVTVGSAPVNITSFTANPTAVVLGNTSTLNWTYTGTPLDLTLDSVSVLGSLSQQVTPYGRQTYTLFGSNLVGNDTATTKVGARALYHVAGSFGSGRGNVDGGVDPNGYSTARFYRPNSISFDEKANDGTMIVCDYSGNIVRRITPDRKVVTIAGTPGVAGTAASGGTLTTCYQPRNSAVDPVTGDIYVGGEGYTTKRLLKLTPNGDGTYTPSAVPGFTLNTNALVIDSNRMMWFVEYSSSTGNLYKMDLTAGAPTATLVANLAPTVTSATAMGKDFNGGRRLLYVVGSNKIFKIDIANEASPVATLLTGSGTGGFVDSLTAATGTVNAPQGISADTAGNVYIADRGNYAVRMIPASGPLAGALITIAGKTTPAAEGYASSSITLDGTATLPTSATACLSNVYYTAAYGDGAAGTKIYVADAGASFDNQAIRVITVSGTAPNLTYTLDDATKPGYAYAGSPRVTGNLDGVGAAASFNFGTSSAANLATLPDGSLTFAADTANNLVRVIAENGTVTTLKDATSANITFTLPKSVAVQVNPTTKALVALFVGDAAATKKIRRFTPNAGGTYTEDTTFTIAGGTFPASVDAQGLALDSTGTGTLYVTDATLARLFKVDLATSVATDLVATTGTKPMGVAVEYNPTTGVAQALWVAAYTSNTVVKYDMAGAVTFTVGGTSGWVDGDLATARLSSPTGIAVDLNGKAYVNNFNATQTNAQNGVRVVNTSTGEVSTLFGYATSSTSATNIGLRPGLVLSDAGATAAAKSLNGGSIYAPLGLTVNQDGDLLVSTPASIYKVVAPASK